MSEIKTNVETGEMSVENRGVVHLLMIPPRYLSEESSDQDKEVGYYLKERLKEIVENDGSDGLVLPQVLDEEGNPYFSYKIIPKSPIQPYRFRSTEKIGNMEVICEANTIEELKALREIHD